MENEVIFEEAQSIACEALYTIVMDKDFANIKDLIGIRDWRDKEKGEAEYRRKVIEAYGELVENQDGDDYIDWQECTVIL